MKCDEEYYKMKNDGENWRGILKKEVKGLRGNKNRKYVVSHLIVNFLYL